MNDELATSWFEALIVGAIVAAAVLWAVVRLVRSLQGRTTCACGTEPRKCPAVKLLDMLEAERKPPGPSRSPDSPRDQP